MKKTCPNCGAETEGNFCPDCGTNLTDVISQDDLENETLAEATLSPQVESKDADSVAQDTSDPAAAIAVNEEAPSIIDAKADKITAEIPKEPSDSKPKKIPKKLIGIIIAVIAVIAAAGAAFMFMGSGSSLISKAYEEGTAEQKIGALTYLMPSAWKIDDTFSNPDAFYETQRYLVKGEDGSDAVDCYVKYCGESRYYGNSLADYESKISGDEVVSEEDLKLTGAEGKHICTMYTDADGNNSYTDTFLVEADGSIFSFEFDTNDSSHDQNGMNTIVSNAQFGSYESPAKEAIVGKGKYAGSANSIMRELLCAIRKNNDTDKLGCGEFTYAESATKGGALCYAIKENGYDTGVAISFYTDKKHEHPLDSFDEVPTSVAVATTMLSFLDYKDTSISLINGTFIEITGDVKFSQGYSKYVNGVEKATGYESLNWYTNSFSLNDFDYELSVSTKTNEYAVFMDVH